MLAQHVGVKLALEVRDFLRTSMLSRWPLLAANSEVAIRPMPRGSELVLFHQLGDALAALDLA